MAEEFKVWCGNLPSEATEALIFELFLQAGPLSRVIIPKDKNYCFITYKHLTSVSYAVSLLNGTTLFGKNIVVKSKNVQQPERQLIESPQGFSMNDVQNLMNMGSQMLIDNNGHSRNDRNYADHYSDRPYNRNVGREERRNDTRPYNKHDDRDREYQNYNNRDNNRNRRNNQTNYNSNYNQYEQNDYSEGQYGNNRNNRRRY